MEVKILEATKDPIKTISMAAGTCYGKPDISIKRIENCYKAGHLSVFEHAYATFYIRGISRSCSHQLVRHRLASFCQESQRYCKLDPDANDWFVTPPDIWEDDWKYTAYESMMHQYMDNYMAALDTMGCKPEDARYLLPEATKTNIVMSANCREIFHILDMRQSHRAQWEIRYLAEELERKLVELPEWCTIMCVRAACNSDSQR